MKRAYFSIADNNNLKYFEMMKNSLKKFDKETDLILFGEKDIKATNDNMIFYRATPYFAEKLFNAGYTEVCKLDADQIITGDLTEIWEGDFDVAVVNNANPREFKAYPVSVWDINPLAYLNCGLVVMKSKTFIDHWLQLCYSDHFNNYQMKEQDLLNIMIYYGMYKVKFLDQGDSFYGLASKGYWPDVVLKEKELILPGNDEWNKEDKKLKVIHWAGGNSPDKMNFQIRFKPEVVEYLEELINDKK